MAKPFLSLVQMNYICQQYAVFFRFAKLMEMLAQGIAEGIIGVPWDLYFNQIKSSPV